jgi:hypothetical protein
MYYVSFINDFSRKTWIYFLRKKSELRCREQIMAESSARMNLNNSVRSAV